MEGAIEKSLSLVIFIFLGILLKKKFSKGDEINGLKNLILTLALPATIFIALLKINIDKELLLLPVLAIIFNVLLFLVSPFLVALLGISKKSPMANTIRLLIPSLAPGLSCFPFILEFLGEGYLAKAAMADLGNKFFVLFILYLVAIRWHYQREVFGMGTINDKLRSLFRSMITEPVNLFIIAALILLTFGISIDGLPSYISSTLDRLSLIMTPVVLLFIGLALKVKRKQFIQILSLLILRGAISLFVVAAVISIFSITINSDILLAIAFSFSACSFWPFAHISNIAYKEKDLPAEKRTFDVDMALSVLALSLPLSVLFILAMFTAGDSMTKMDNILIIAGLLLLLGGIHPLFQWLNKIKFSRKALNINTELMSPSREME